MRQCPSCKQLFEDTVEICPNDENELLPPDPLFGRTVDGKYVVDACLGSGGQGAVYRATHLHLRRLVAFKVIHGDFARNRATIERFKREARALASIKHPNVVAIYDFGIEPGVGAYLVMEHLVGRSL